jgi:hypothetical protein
MSAPADKKRKRTGKQREEAKRAAIEAAAAAEAGAEAAPEAIDEDHADEAATTGAGVEVEAEVAETNGDVDEASAEGEAVPEKRRKRTGKMREEAKRLAIQVG